MSLRADVDTKFIRRFLIIGIGCLLFMLWGGYDALFKYPGEYKAAKEYKHLYQMAESNEITEAERASRWEELRNANNWPSKPNSAEVANQYIYFNWFLFGAGLVGGAFFLMKYMKLVGSWMEAKDDGVETSWGQSLKFKQVVEVNKRRWVKKGIAVVTYHEDSGAESKLVLDDFKYHRESVGEILKLVEKGLEDDQIVFGNREGSVAESDPEVLNKVAE